MVSNLSIPRANCGYLAGFVGHHAHEMAHGDSVTAARPNIRDRACDVKRDMPFHAVNANPFQEWNQRLGKMATRGNFTRAAPGHGLQARKFAISRSPVAWLFSGWNCVPTRLSRPTTAVIGPPWSAVARTRARIVRGQVVRMHEIGVVALGDPRQHRMLRDPLQRVPAHVRHLERGIARRDAHHLAADPAEARRVVAVLETASRPSSACRRRCRGTARPRRSPAPRSPRRARRAPSAPRGTRRRPRPRAARSARPGPPPRGRTRPPPAAGRPRAPCAGSSSPPNAGCRWNSRR